MSAKLDPHSEEEYWNTIKQRKIQIPITVNEQGEVNLAPLEPHLKVVCISDTHEQLDCLTNVPDGDVLIHAGDFTNFGSEEEVRKFNKQMERFPHKYKLVVAGNHELGFDDTEVIEDRLEIYKGLGTKSGYHLLTSVIWLHDKGIEIENVRFYGSSWHPLPGYSFSVPRTRLATYWSTIPSDTDVLITHSPPLGYLDCFGNERWGCRELLKDVEERIKPRFHVFGHVHECFGAVTNGRTVFINAAQASKSNVISNRPLVFYIPITA